MSASDISGTNNLAVTEDLKESGEQECVPTEDATANELFDSFMEIANDPNLHNYDHADGTLDQNDTHAVDSSLSDLQNGRCNQNETVDLQGKVQVEEPEKVEVGATAVSTESTSSPVSEGTVKGDSQGPFPLSDQLASDVDPVQSVTGEPMENMEQVTVNPVTNEREAEELCAKADKSETSSPAIGISNEDERTEQRNSETELLEESSGDKGERATVDVKERQETADLKDQSAVSPGPSDHKESSTGQCSLPNDGDPNAPKVDVAQRLSRAMENLAGLEQLLSTAVSEFKVVNSENKIDESNDGEEVKDDAKESAWLDDENKELDPGSLVTEAEERDDVDGNEVKLQHSEALVEGSDTPVCETGKEQAGCEAGAQNAITDLCVSDMASPDDVPPTNELSPNDMTSELQDISEKANGDDVESPAVTLEEEEQDTAELQHANTETSAGSPEEVKEDAPSNKDCQVEGHEVGGLPSDVQGDFQGGALSDIQEISNQGDLKSQTSVEESPRKTLLEEVKNTEKAPLEKSDTDNKIDSEVANASMAVPDIEITMTDESGISENKSLDSLNTEESSNSRPASPTGSDEGIDSDVPSDYGDEDEDATFDPDHPNSLVCHRKSLLLELDRERLSSDSSTVSEKDFKVSYDKRDTADGKSPAKDYIEGHLLKLGGTGLTPKNWRKRWCVLRSDNCLYYYKNSKDKVPCGVIIMSNYSVSKAPEVNKNHCFKLTKGGARTYYMCAASESEMKKWMVSMMNAAKESAKDSNPFNISEGNVHNVSIPALSIRDPDCHGYLHKQGSNYKIWRRRYFVLKNGFLYYYTDMSNTVALGVAKLLDYTVTPGEHSGKKFYFSAASPDQSCRTYHFAAESEMDRKRWLLRLEDSIRKGSSTH